MSNEAVKPRQLYWSWILWILGLVLGLSLGWVLRGVLEEEHDSFGGAGLITISTITFERGNPSQLNMPPTLNLKGTVPSHNVRTYTYTDQTLHVPEAAAAFAANPTQDVKWDVTAVPADDAIQCILTGTAAPGTTAGTIVNPMLVGYTAGTAATPTQPATQGRVCVRPSLSPLEPQACIDLDVGNADELARVLESVTGTTLMTAPGTSRATLAFGQTSGPVTVRLNLNP